MNMLLTKEETVKAIKKYQKHTVLWKSLNLKGPNVKHKLFHKTT
jgi:hypothetical protein